VEDAPFFAVGGLVGRGGFAARRRSCVAWHELAVGGGLPLCIGVGLLRIVAAFFGAVGRFGAPCSGTRLRSVHEEELVGASGVQSMGSANSRPGGAQCGLAVDVVVDAGPGWRVYVASQLPTWLWRRCRARRLDAAPAAACSIRRSGLWGWIGLFGLRGLKIYIGCGA